MDALNALIDDGELLLDEAAVRRCALPQAVEYELRVARENAAVLRSDVSKRQTFYDALKSTEAIVKSSVAQIKVDRAHRERIEQRIACARGAVDFAAATGLGLDPAIRSAVLKSADALEPGVASAADEQAFDASVSDLERALHQPVEQLRMKNEGRKRLMAKIAEVREQLGLTATGGTAVPEALRDPLIQSMRALEDGDITAATEQAFYSALNSAEPALTLAAKQILLDRGRRERLIPQIAAARELLAFATANGKKVDAETREPLTKAAESIEAGTGTLADEQSFLKAYEALAISLTPVTAETLQASATRLPHFFDFLGNRAKFAEAFRHLTLGRFLHIIVFSVVLLGAGSAMAYYSVGNAALGRYVELKELKKKLMTEGPGKQALANFRQQELTKAEKAFQEDPKTASSLAAAQQSNKEASEAAITNDVQLKDAATELKETPQRLWTWTQIPCKKEWTTVFYWNMCSPLDSATPEDSVTDIYRVNAAQAIAAQMSQVFLPMLLGFLGAYAFILRNLADLLARNALGRGSAIQHAIRLGTGALAGLVSAWMFRPEVVSVELKNVPAWIVAFIAGYGVEIVFEFMNRIVGAFTSQKPAA